MTFDFSGYATKANLKCSDGRTIGPDAFKHMDGKKVPLVWQHKYNEPSNVLGYGILEHRKDGVYARCSFNDSPSGKNAKTLVHHGDIVSLSIRANKLVEKDSYVTHGVIQEVSLVLSGANPGAFIDNVSVVHGEEVEVLDDEVIIYTGTNITHSSEDENNETPDSEDEINHEEEESKMAEKTVGDVVKSLTEEQKNVLYFLIGQAVENKGDAEAEHQDGDDHEMTHNVFEGEAHENEDVLTHDQLEAIVKDAEKIGSLKESFLMHAEEYGIQNIDILFPDAKSLDNTPEWIKRHTEWAATLMGGTHHSPFSRIKTMSADIRHEEARARGYVKGNLKKEEFFALSKRVTTPTTIYKKQKLDRDDIVDITTLDVVAWLKAEMRVMLDEEIARAVLLGDGRDFDDEDKIDETKLRPIATDDDFYAHKVDLPTNVAGASLVEAIIRARKYYRGTGTPTMFASEDFITSLLLLKDKMGRNLYDSESDLASKLRVSKIVPVEVMDEYPEIMAVVVNLRDYTIGADRGGNIAMFDDFDIDYNQYKYLIETRISGALTKFKSALVFRRASGTSVTPTAPTQSGNDLTIPDTTGVVYSIDGLEVSGTYTMTDDTTVEADPDTGYYFSNNAQRVWEYTYTA